MARNRRIKKEGDGHYHVISRTNNKAFLFSKGRVKSEIVSALRRSAAFSGVKIHAFAIMDNHVHIVCGVIKSDEPLGEEEVLHRIAILKGQKTADAIAEHWAELRRMGNTAAVDEQLSSWRRRMNDVSEFAKTFKEIVNILYKREMPHCGSIWSGRFKSTLIEDGRYLATCIRYVELNPVRAGIVTQAKNYAWSSANDEKDDTVMRFAGSVPGWEEVERRLMRRVAQITDGAVFGSCGFVTKNAIGLGRLFTGRPVARLVMAETYATHGYRLAAKMEKVA